MDLQPALNDEHSMADTAEISNPGSVKPEGGDEEVLSSASSEDFPMTTSWPERKVASSVSLHVIEDKASWMGKAVMVMRGPKVGSIGRVVDTASGWIEVHEAPKNGTDPFLIPLEERSILKKRAVELNLLKSDDDEDFNVGDSVFVKEGEYQGRTGKVTAWTDTQVVLSIKNVAASVQKDKSQVERRTVRIVPPPSQQQLHSKKRVPLQNNEEEDHQQDDNDSQGGGGEPMEEQQLPQPQQQRRTTKRSRKIRAIPEDGDVKPIHETSTLPPRKNIQPSNQQQVPSSKRNTATIYFRLEESMRLRRENIQRYLKKNKDLQDHSLPNRENLQDWLEDIGRRNSNQEEDEDIPLLFAQPYCRVCFVEKEMDEDCCWNQVCWASPVFTKKGEPLVENAYPRRRRRQEEGDDDEPQVLGQGGWFPWNTTPARLLIRPSPLVGMAMRKRNKVECHDDKEEL